MGLVTYLATGDDWVGLCHCQVKQPISNFQLIGKCSNPYLPTYSWIKPSRYM